MILSQNGEKLVSPFNKWNKEKINSLIKKNGFIVSNDFNGGIFCFHKGTDTFENKFLIYLTKSGLYICNQSVRVTNLIKSYKAVDCELNRLAK